MTWHDKKKTNERVERQMGEPEVKINDKKEKVHLQKTEKKKYEEQNDLPIINVFQCPNIAIFKKMPE